WSTTRPFSTTFRRARDRPTLLRKATSLYRFLSVAVVWTACGLIGCGTAPPVTPYAGPTSLREAIYVNSGGWHTEGGPSVEALGGSLRTLKRDLPYARYLVFGWGARDYYMAQSASVVDLLRAAVPGPAVMLVIPLETSPEAFFGASNVFALPA